jgi:hypothetical protein
MLRKLLLEKTRLEQRLAELLAERARREENKQAAKNAGRAAEVVIGTGIWAEGVMAQGGGGVPITNARIAKAAKEAKNFSGRGAGVAFIAGEAVYKIACIYAVNAAAATVMAKGWWHGWAVGQVNAEIINQLENNPQVRAQCSDWEIAAYKSSYQ